MKKNLCLLLADRDEEEPLPAVGRCAGLLYAGRMRGRHHIHFRGPHQHLH